MYDESIFEEYSLVNNEKSENQRKDAMNIIERWESCESIDEAKKLLERSDDIYSSIAEAVADSDNLVKFD